MQNDTDIKDDLPALDVRSVAIIWGDDEPMPNVSFSNCSAFEAIGLLRVATRKLENEYALDEYDDEDE